MQSCAVIAFNIFLMTKFLLSCTHCTEVCFASFLSGEFSTMARINPLEGKLVKRISVQCPRITGCKNIGIHRRFEDMSSFWTPKPYQLFITTGWMSLLSIAADPAHISFLPWNRYLACSTQHIQSQWGLNLHEITVDSQYFWKCTKTTPWKCSADWLLIPSCKLGKNEA